MEEQKIQSEFHTHKSPVQPTVALVLSRLTRPAVLITLGIGMYLHFTRLFLGTELLIKYIYTAAFDAVFAVPMLIGAVSFLSTWKHIVFRNKFEKALVAVTGIYFLLSLPLHVQTWYTQNTNYILGFPMWFSLVFLTYSSLLVFVWWRLQIVFEE